MSETVFTKVDYDLGTLIKYISLGEIGLPDIQRPFVWNNAKVRDLFHSIYSGYPVGYFLFWKNSVDASERTIGDGNKQKRSQLLIVDGQQRLTSLYAVIKSTPIVRENYESEFIKIAFNPLDNRFEVTDAAIIKDKTFIPDISILWRSETKITRIIREYIENLRQARDIVEEEEDLIEDRILKVQGLLSFPFTALELAPDLDVEDVSEVFVRINSKGTSLNQSDFILTLLSVYWDEGRVELEDFCRKSRQPIKGKPSSYNHIIEPLPDQLLKVSVAVAFKRARLRYVYSILRGKDLETEKFSAELRDKQFDKLKEAQRKVLNLQYWHDFLNCIRLAGFRSNKMISSKNNLLYTYALYLIGRTEYNVPLADLRMAISRWFFMASLTGRYSSSPESVMESDLAKLRNIVDAEQFLELLDWICGITLTNDFWNVNLPNDLASTASRGPALFGFWASQILLEAPVLFSRFKVVELLDPAIQSYREAKERHHLFPSGYLKEQGVTDSFDINQIANYSFVEWGDNVKISDRAPADYVSEMNEGFSKYDTERMYHLHALPNNWEYLSYREFLEKRREMIAQLIEEGYEKLAGREMNAEIERLNLSEILIEGENDFVEYKSTLRVNLHTGEKDNRMELAVLKTIAAFLNTDGGTLLIGVSDDGIPVGIERDGFDNEDKMYLHLTSIVKTRMDVSVGTMIHVHYESHNDQRIMVVECSKSHKPIFVKDCNLERFYIRTGASTTELSPSQTHDYVKVRFL
jgi:hypothetical protein